MIARRAFLALSSALAATSFAAPKPRRVLVASQWRNVNIGDIAHGPGLLRLIQRHLPDAELAVWAACSMPSG